MLQLASAALRLPVAAQLQTLLVTLDAFHVRRAILRAQRAFMRRHQGHVLALQSPSSSAKRPFCKDITQMSLPTALKRLAVLAGLRTARAGCQGCCCADCGLQRCCGRSPRGCARDRPQSSCRS